MTAGKGGHRNALRIEHCIVVSVQALRDQRSHHEELIGMTLFGLVSGLFRQGGLRATVYALFGGLMLSTLWVTSLASLSAQPNATDLLTEAGTQVLNPFLVKQDLGLTLAGYAQLQATGKAHPTQPLAVPLL